MDNLYNIAKSAAAEVIEKANLKEGQVLVVGCSSSEIGGEKIGTNSKNLMPFAFDSPYNKSYNNYLYQIADVYNVSVAWLMGEIDDPAPKAKESGNTDILQLLKDNAPLMSNKDLAEAIRLLVESLGNKE